MDVIRERSSRLLAVIILDGVDGQMKMQCWTEGNSLVFIIKQERNFFLIRVERLLLTARPGVQ